MEIANTTATGKLKTSGAGADDDFSELRDRALVSKINKMRQLDNSTNWKYIAIEYAYLFVVMGIGFAFCCAWAVSALSTWIFIPCWLAITVLIGIGQHRLVMLGHEASHFSLFRNKALNDTASDWFCFYPIWVTTYNYRIQHMAHHQHTNDPELDPDYAYMSVCGHQYQPPMERNDFLWKCIVGPALAIPNQLRFLFIRLKLALLTGVLAKFRRPEGWVGRVILASFLVIFLAGLGYAYFGNRPELLWPWAGLVMVGALVAVLVAPRKSLIEGSYKPFVDPRLAMFMRMLYIVLLFTVITQLRFSTGLPFVMAYYFLWVMPLATTFSFLMVLREDIQHSHTEPGRFRNTRDAEVPVLMKWAVFPYGMDLHLAHHLFAMVPHYRLSELNDLLETTSPYRDQREIFGPELQASK